MQGNGINTFFLQNKRNSISVAQLNQRTTSLIESVNSVIQRSFPDRTHILKFVESLKLYESIKSTDLYQIVHDEIETPILQRKRSKDKARDEKIKWWSAYLAKKEITIAEFLDQMSGKDVLPSNGT